ncbi:ecotropic viral integration site 5 protein, partial [Phenoliferia sp. Uapishka_3]
MSRSLASPGSPTSSDDSGEVFTDANLDSNSVSSSSRHPVSPPAPTPSKLHGSDLHAALDDHPAGEEAVVAHGNGNESDGSSLYEQQEGKRTGKGKERAASMRLSISSGQSISHIVPDMEEDEPEEDLTELRIYHSDDDSDAEQQESKTPTSATTPTRTTLPDTTAPPQLPTFDISRTSLTETSLARNSSPPPPPPLEKDADSTPSSGSGTAADASRRFSLASLSAPETPSAFTSVTEHMTSSPSGTDVSDGQSPSITGALWRNSLSGNGKAALGLVDVNLSDNEENSGSEQVEDGLGISRNGMSAKANGKRSAEGREGKEKDFSFLLQRLESQNTLLEIDPKTKRLSIQGSGQLRKGFEKLQKEASDKDTSIDWGNAVPGDSAIVSADVRLCADFWGAVMNDYEHVASTQPRELSRAIQQGIPPALRGMTWQLMSASKDQELEATYAALLKQTSSHEKSIGRDLGRTFPKHEYFMAVDGAGQENLQVLYLWSLSWKLNVLVRFNVVKAYSLYDEEVGYTQGIQFIVGPLLLNMPDEEAFCVLVRLMNSYDLRSHYTPNMPGLQLRLFQFDRLVEELLPGIFMHLLRQGVKSSMYASQWFLTLFGYRFPLELVSSVFDLVFAEGVEAIFRFSVAILQRNEAKICELEFEYLLEYLKNGLFEAYAPDFDDPNPDPLYRADQFVRDALQIKVTPLMLDQFGEEWENLCRQQNAHTAEIENLRRANSQLSAQVRGLETSLSQINIEHCELVRQVVMAKLEREELEDELVKYKIAFAEISHRNEVNGAQSSRASQERLAERISRGSI